jgi:hypothetical protein
MASLIWSIWVQVGTETANPTKQQKTRKVFILFLKMFPVEKLPLTLGDFTTPCDLYNLTYLFFCGHWYDINVTKYFIIIDANKLVFEPGLPSFFGPV